MKRLFIMLLVVGMVGCGKLTVLEPPTPVDAIAEEAQIELAPPAEPTPAPSVEPTPLPSTEPTPNPSVTPAPSPTPSPTPAPNGYNVILTLKCANNYTEITEWANDEDAAKRVIETLVGSKVGQICRYVKGRYEIIE